MDSVKIFNRSKFDIIRNELRNISKVIKWNPINSNVSISSTETIDISRCISEVLYNQFKNVQNIEVSNSISFIKYSKYNNINEYIPDRRIINNDLEYCLVICLDNSTSVKTKIYPSYETTITSSEDIMFSKNLNFKFENINHGYKVVVCSVSITYKPSICRIQYGDRKYVDIGTDKKGNNLCFCVITMNPHHLIDLETVCVLVDRAGKCLIVNDFYIRFKKNSIYNTFTDLCMDYIFEIPESEELFTLHNEDGRNIAWDNDKLEKCYDTWVPKTDDDYDFLSKLMTVTTKYKNGKFDYYVLVGDTDPCTIFTFKVTKYYLNLM
ncbi:interleukin 1 receptor antagonist [Cotia virus SPAn232]|uniref:Interleukin 1 receptor antagonist n=2 Tax=Cotia virus TaxID=39444 RepID=H6TAH8_9POXV|nr:interleukin 1 receptor antagonist [Cotia virus SPAn232]AFB76915.1 interleukin 1 receptor antagonist [Cotia virus SPAn232]AIT70640.1 interleukin 1 receptor antagonist [Cotia virus]